MKIIHEAALVMCNVNCERIEIKEPCGTHLSLAKALYEAGYLKEVK